ncbi:MAG TPA: ATPase domain-containing protein [Casimicrobiaceae bacterium]|nr:ATPase domain-containing protein [Casimicrobiaceae bacterium]
MTTTSSTDVRPPDPTGIPGLDYVLRGGLPAGHLYLVQGTAGAGKTTLALQFLMEGARRGESVVWCTLSETEAQIRAIARSHDWDLSGIRVVNLTDRSGGTTLPDAQYSFFSPADIELDDVTRAVVDLIERERPRRLVFDPFSDVRLLARDPLRYRRQVLELREHFERAGVTVLLILEQDVLGAAAADPAAEGIVHGIFGIYQTAPDYGRPRRRMRILKLRGLNYREGFHDLALNTGGIVVFPRLVASDHAQPSDAPPASTGLEALDAMLGGGLDRGASLLITGPAGTGKSTLASQFAVAAARRGERAALYLFDETLRAFDARSDGLRLGVDAPEVRDLVRVVQVDPAEVSPGEFAHNVRRAVEEDGCTLVTLDSLNGYLSAMPDERHLALHMHELLTYLSLRRVVTILTVNQTGFSAGAVESPVEVSYLADTVLALRYFEADGAVRRAASVVKRRCGGHEFTIRDMEIAPGGVRFGHPLSEFRGVLTGQPEYTGAPGQLQPARPDGSRTSA